MVRVSDLNVQCPSCENLVNPNRPARWVVFGIVGAIVVGAIGTIFGLTIGIATAGTGFVASWALAPLGAVVGWKLGVTTCEWWNGYTCPSCGSQFQGPSTLTKLGEFLSEDGASENLSTPAATSGRSPTSHPEKTKDESTSESSSSVPVDEETKAPNQSFAGESGEDTLERANGVFGSDFTVAFSCANCGKEWDKSFSKGAEISDTDESAIVDHPNGTGKIVCPTCETDTQVQVRERSPEVGQPPDMSLKEITAGSAFSAVAFVSFTLIQSLEIGFVVGLVSLLFTLGFSLVSAYA